MKNKEAKRVKFNDFVDHNPLIPGRIYKISRRNHDFKNTSFNFSSRGIEYSGDYPMTTEVDVRIINDNSGEGYILYLGEFYRSNSKVILKIVGMGGVCYDSLKTIKDDYTIYAVV